MKQGRAGKVVREVHGILLLDKPKGFSSNAVLQQVKRLYCASKAGHTGNLDPLATGMLPICLGEATKISGFLLDADKFYTAKCRLGITTTTGDCEGEVLTNQPVSEFANTELESVMNRFRGEIDQVPPMYSALKHKGKPLYKLARQGQEVERQPRRVTIYDLEIQSNHDCEVIINVKCSKGTYIRTLVEDIGKALGCGAHVAELRRTMAFPFVDQPMSSLETLEQLAEKGFEALDECLLPVDSALHNWPAVRLSPALALHIKQGQAVSVSEAPDDGLLRLYARQTGGQQFIGIGQVLKDGRIGPKRLIFC